MERRARDRKGQGRVSDTRAILEKNRETVDQLLLIDRPRVIVGRRDDA